MNGTVIVVGDVMLDVYIHGEAVRLSPEAPVPIVSVTGRTNTLGGAGNVALNIVGLGCNVRLFGMRGNDVAGNVIADILNSKRIPQELYVSMVHPTTTKTRVMANHQQLIRFDDEYPDGNNGCYTHVRNTFVETFHTAKAIVLSDYDKGVLSYALIKHIISLSNEARIPVLVDPKRSDWNYYNGATVITPNVSELEAAIGEKCDGDDGMVLDAAKILANRHGFEAVVVTRGPKGMLVITGGTHKFIPTVAKSVYDVSGAGDTVIATMATWLSRGKSIIEAAEVANIAAGIVVGKLGTCPIQMDELEKELA